MKYDLYEFQQAESNISFSPRLGRRSMMEFSILPGDTLQKWPALFTEEEYRRICGICEVPPNDKDELDIHEKFTLLTNNKGIVQKLKEKSLKDYQILKLFNIIHTLREDFPDERKSDWVHVTTRSEINDKMVDHSDYFTWMYRDFRTDPVNRMTGRSIVSIIHQDSFLIEPMLDDIAQIFKTAIEWSGEKIKDLKDQMALFRYELSHAMPFERGSSAIAEWFERAIYLFHGMDITYTPDKMVDLEALTSSLKDFVDNYETMIQLDSTTEAMCAVNN